LRWIVHLIATWRTWNYLGRRFPAAVVKLRERFLILEMRIANSGKIQGIGGSEGSALE
jgi:hypothetical protein